MHLPGDRRWCTAPVRRDPGHGRSRAQTVADQDPLILEQVGEFQRASQLRLRMVRLWSSENRNGVSQLRHLRGRLFSSS